VDAYIATRHAAYLGRWKEAGRFITPGSKLLDVGGGNLFPGLLTYLKNLNVEYHYLDVDPSAVAGSAKLASEMGFNGDYFNHGFNDKFNYPSSHFNIVFSSHCLEHSIDLASTFAELNRIIMDGGFLLMAVPFGWEENPEHPYFFSPEHWIALVEDSGFEVRISQIGREYPENGFDYFIAAKKVGSVSDRKRLNPRHYMKESYLLCRNDHFTISYAGNKQLIESGAACHMRGPDWEIKIVLDRDFNVILPIFVRHNWSGNISVTGGGVESYHDLFSWFHYVQPCFHFSGNGYSDTITIKPIGRNSSSWSTEGVFYGYLIS
ncbi:MAG: class I SAM-dependent methyltransferase, partial [Mucilaginibacter sp.]